MEEHATGADTNLRPADKEGVILMPTDLAIAIARKAQARGDTETDVAVASVWLAFYLLMLVGSLSKPALAQAIELAALY